MSSSDCLFVSVCVSRDWTTLLAGFEAEHPIRKLRQARSFPLKNLHQVTVVKYFPAKYTRFPGKHFV